MQAQNVKEYLEIRKEQTELRSCVNLYVGFVVVGAGPALFGLIDKQTKPAMSSLLAIFTATLTSLITWVLFYKFISHNRYAGYGKLLTHEQYDCKKNAPTDLFGWEICLDWLRDLQNMDGKLATLLKSRGVVAKSLSNNVNSQLEQLSGERPIADRRAFVKGTLLLLQQIIFFKRKGGSNTWGYPIHVLGILAVECALFLGVAAEKFIVPGYGMGAILTRGSSHVVLLVLAGAGLLMTGKIWVQVLSGLYKLMYGSLTVDAFCWLFVPTRVRLIDETYRSKEYRLVGLRDA